MSSFGFFFFPWRGIRTGLVALPGSQQIWWKVVHLKAFGGCNCWHVFLSVGCRWSRWQFLLQREHLNASISIWLLVHMLLATQLQLLISFSHVISCSHSNKSWPKSSLPAILMLRGTSGPWWTNLASKRLLARLFKLTALYPHLLLRVKPRLLCQLKFILNLMDVTHTRRRYQNRRRRRQNLLKLQSLWKLLNLWRMMMRRRPLLKSQRILWTSSPQVQWSWTTGSVSTRTQKQRIFILQSVVLMICSPFMNHLYLYMLLMC